MRPHPINGLNNFISGWYIDNDKLCEDIIEYHKIAPDRTEGKIGESKRIDKSLKDSTDAYLQANVDLYNRYGQELQKVLNKYIEQYPECDKCAPFTITEGINIQHYKPEGGYYIWHCERAYPKFPNIARHLVFITYLNDVDDQGETEFKYQNVKIKPERGLTIIFPADWTFYHRGISSPTQEKYIVTGWFNFIEREQWNSN